MELFHWVKFVFEDFFLLFLRKRSRTSFWESKNEGRTEWKSGRCPLWHHRGLISRCVMHFENNTERQKKSVDLHRVRWQRLRKDEHDFNFCLSFIHFELIVFELIINWDQMSPRTEIHSLIPFIITFSGLFCQSSGWKYILLLTHVFFDSIL